MLSNTVFFPSPRPGVLSRYGFFPSPEVVRFFRPGRARKERTSEKYWNGRSRVCIGADVDARTVLLMTTPRVPGACQSHMKSSFYVKNFLRDMFFSESFCMILA